MKRDEKLAAWMRFMAAQLPTMSVQSAANEADDALQSMISRDLNDAMFDDDPWHEHEDAA